MNRRLPSLNALKAFESAARHESFSQAALELFVTQGAISQQVKQLELELGFKLFTRQSQGVTITLAGADYLAIIKDAFDRIAIGTRRITQQNKSSTLTVSTSPDFAAKWLVHRLGSFSELHPEIDLRISATPHHVDFANEDIDMAVRHGAGEWPGLDVVQLCPEMLFPVCSPDLIRPRKTRLDAVRSLKYSLLHLNDRTGWSRWLKASKVVIDKPLVGLILNRDSMVIDAACNGQGIALSRTTLATWELLNGRLVAPFKDAHPLPNCYWIIAPKASAEMPKIKVFRDWLISEALTDAKRLRELLGRDLFALPNKQVT
jgi:LysR family transcriptional regulator, glycine cleavage system transcriptional activator